MRLDPDSPSKAAAGPSSVNGNGRVTPLNLAPRPARPPDPARSARSKPTVCAGPQAAGKFFSRGGDKVYLKGVTYGTFAPDADGVVYSPQVAQTDFAAMAQAGINALRVYTVPPRWLLDAAEDHGLSVLIGLPSEHHVAFADDRS